MVYVLGELVVGAYALSLFSKGDLLGSLPFAIVVAFPLGFYAYKLPKKQP